MKGFITSVNSGVYIVFDGEKFITCKARGLFRKHEITPLVGDNVLIELITEKEGYIIQVFPRKNELKRPPIANVDQVMIIVSLSHPKISLSLISRYIILSSLAGIKPVIIINKIDRDDLEQEYYDHVINTLKTFDYQLISISAKTGQNVDAVLALIKGKKTVITGQSGVGKSTLLNQFFTEDILKTNDISLALGRGKHTTRIVEYFRVNEGFIADTPGFSNIEFNLTPTELAYMYPGFEPYLNKCKFRGCLHEKETGCQVIKDVENNIFPLDHYQDYLSLLNDLKNKKERY